MQLDVNQYARKPFTVQAVQVTQENIDDVALWSDGKVVNEADSQFVKIDVRRPLHERQTKAYPGDWVLRAGQGFRVYNDSAFRNQFDKVVDVSDSVVAVNPTDINFVSAGPVSSSMVLDSMPVIVGGEVGTSGVTAVDLSALAEKYNTV